MSEYEFSLTRIFAIYIYDSVLIRENTSQEKNPYSGIFYAVWLTNDFTYIYFTAAGDITKILLRKSLEKLINY